MSLILESSYITLSLSLGYKLIMLMRCDYFLLSLTSTTSSSLISYSPSRRNLSLDNRALCCSTTRTIRLSFQSFLKFIIVSYHHQPNLEALRRSLNCSHNLCRGTTSLQHLSKAATVLHRYLTAVRRTVISYATPAPAPQQLIVRVFVAVHGGTVNARSR